MIYDIELIFEEKQLSFKFGGAEIVNMPIDLMESWDGYSNLGISGNLAGKARKIKIVESDSFICEDYPSTSETWFLINRTTFPWPRVPDVIPDQFIAFIFTFKNIKDQSIPHLYYRKQTSLIKDIQVTTDCRNSIIREASGDGSLINIATAVSGCSYAGLYYVKVNIIFHDGSKVEIIRNFRIISGDLKFVKIIGQNSLTKDGEICDFKNSIDQAGNSFLKCGDLPNGDYSESRLDSVLKQSKDDKNLRITFKLVDDFGNPSTL